MALSGNFAQQVKADADIVRIIGEHLRLRKSRWRKGRLLHKLDSDFEAAMGM